MAGGSATPADRPAARVRSGGTARRTGLVRSIQSRPRPCSRGPEWPSWRPPPAWCFDDPANGVLRRSRGRPGHAGVLVIGVVTEDTSSAAQSLVDDLRLTFPMLYDRAGKLKQASGKVALPVTIFLDASGRLANVYNGPALDDATLRALTVRHL